MFAVLAVCYRRVEVSDDAVFAIGSFAMKVGVLCAVRRSGGEVSNLPRVGASKNVSARSFGLARHVQLRLTLTHFWK